MHKFKKTDLVNDSDGIVSVIEANSLRAALEDTVRELSNDDRLCPCHGLSVAETLSIVDNSIYFAPGDGGEYEIVTIESA